MFNNSKLRLLMTQVGFERLGVEDVPGASWIVPSALTSKQLRDTKSIIDTNIENPVTEVNGYDPRHQLRQKRLAESRGDYISNSNVNFGSDSEGEENMPDGPFFPSNIPSRSNSLDELKKKRRQRRQDDDDNGPLDEAMLEARRRAREAKALARQAKIKSDLYVHASDEETDEEADREFFRLEEERRKAQAKRIRTALLTGVLEDGTGEKNKIQKGRKRTSDDESDSEVGQRKRQKHSILGVDSDDDGDESAFMAGVERSSASQGRDSVSCEAEDDTPPTSAPDELDFDDDLAFRKERMDKNSSRSGTVITTQTTSDDAAGSDEDEDALVVPPRRSRRMRGGFVLDSDSE